MLKNEIKETNSQEDVGNKPKDPTQERIKRFPQDIKGVPRIITVRGQLRIHNGTNQKALQKCLQEEEINSVFAIFKILKD